MPQSFTFKYNYGNGWQSGDPPHNWKGLVVKIIFVNQSANASLSGYDYIWHGKECNNINNYFNSHGVSEGVGVQIYTCDSTPIKFFEGYINGADQKARFQCDEVSAPLVETGKIDWLNKICVAISFNFLATSIANGGAGILSLNDCMLTPYCVHQDRDLAKEAIIALETYTLLREGYEAARKIAEYIELLLGDTSTALATLGTATPTVLARVLGILEYIVELALLIVALINLFKQLIEYFFQLKKYKACMTYADHFKKICQYFNMNFHSTILLSGTYANDTWMPAKTIIPDLSNPLNVFKRPYDESVNFPNNKAVTGWFSGNCSDFIVHACKKFNAEITLIANANGIIDMYFEEKHYWNNIASFTIPNTDANGNTRNLPDPHGNNKFELASNYIVEFATDISDTNTDKRFTGTNCEICIVPNIIYNQLNVANEKGVMVQLECALAKRKDYLARYEELINTALGGLTSFLNSVVGLVNELLNAINTVIALFGGNTTTFSPIPSYPQNLYALTRLGWMVLSSDTFSTAKCFIGKQVGNDWQIDPNNETNMSANALMQNFHGKNLGTRGNQQLVFDKKTFHFCCADYIKLIQKNVITSPDGRLGKMVSFDWDVYNERAINAEYRIFANFDSPQHEVITIDGIIQ